MKKALTFIAVIVVLITYAWNIHMQHFNQDSKTTATSGIYFQKTLNLEAYKYISNGNDVWGTYNRYSRSDRHSEALIVYCNDYCK